MRCCTAAERRKARKAAFRDRQAYYRARFTVGEAGDAWRTSPELAEVCEFAKLNRRSTINRNDLRQRRVVPLNAIPTRIVIDLG